MLRALALLLLILIAAPAAASETPLAACDRLAAQPAEPGHHGRGVDADHVQIAEAIPACQGAAAAAPGDIPTTYRLGRLRSLDGSFAAASWLLRISATYGYSSAWLSLASMYERGDGVRKDDKISFEMSLRAAMLGNESAAFNLAQRYANAIGVDANRQEALRWFQVALDSGSPDAEMQAAEQAHYGSMPDLDVASKYYKLAASHGSLDALAMLGTLIVECNCKYGKAEDGMEMLRQASAAGVFVAMANLGRAYATGLGGLDVDYARAVPYFEDAATHDYPPADYWLGIIYGSGGHGIPRDPAQALQYYAVAAKLGYVDAYYQIGLIYDHGDGVEASSEYAEQFFTAAAQGGNADAQLALGQTLLRTNGASTGREASAIAWLERAGEAGRGESYLELAQYFSLPAGDIDRAIRYAELGAQSPDARAAQESRDLLPTLHQMRDQRHSTGALSR